MGNKSFASLLLISAGVLSLGYGGYHYMKEAHSTDAPSIATAIGAKQHIPNSIWAGVGALLAGGLLLSTRKNG